MGQGAAVLAVLLGTELTRLHKLHGIKRGGNRRSKDQTRNVAGLKWEELVKQELRISEDSAKRYMDLADGAKKRLPEFASIAEELLSTPLSALPEARRIELAEKTRNILPSETARWRYQRRPGRRHADGRGERIRTHCLTQRRRHEAFRTVRHAQ